MKNHKKAQKLQGLPLAAGTFSSVRSTHMAVYQLLPFVLALAMAGSVLAQRADNTNQALSATQKAAPEQVAWRAPHCPAETSSRGVRT
jgi:hypothetical protein